MNRATEQARLAEQLYDAALDPATWPSAMTALADHLGSKGSQCLAFKPQADELVFGAVGRIDPDAEREYEKHYFHLDFRRPRYLSHTPFVAFTDHDITTPAERRRSPFHQEFLTKYDCGNLLLANFPLTNSVKGLLVMGRSLSGREFDADARRQFLRQIAPLRTAMRMRLEIRRLEGRVRTLETFLDTCGFGVFLLDEAGCVRYANGEALRIAAPGDCLRLRHDRLQPVAPDAATRYAAALAQSVPPDVDALAWSGIALRLPRPYGKPGVDLYVRPFHHTGWRMFGPLAEYAVILVDTSARTLDTTMMLSTLFGFTSAEARCAKLLRDGLSVTEIADRLQLSKATVRAHLRNLFRKTDTRRQGELVARLHAGLLVIAAGEPK